MEIIKTCEDLSRSTGLATALDTCRRALGRQLSLVASIRNLERYAREGPVSSQTRTQRTSLGANLAAWNREAAVVVSADADREQQLRGFLTPMRQRLAEDLDLGFDDHDDGSDDDHDDLDAALLDELRESQLLPKVRRWA